jgi:hypothetical protein
LGNVGLHHSRAEASLQGGVVGGAADSVKKAKVYKSGSSSGLKTLLITSSDNDVKVDVRKNFMNHWIFKDVKYQFIVENVNTWDPHPICITNIIAVKKGY